MEGFSGPGGGLAEAPGGLRVGGWSFGPAPLFGAGDPAAADLASPSASHVHGPLASSLELRDPAGALAVRIRPSSGPGGAPSAEGPLLPRPPPAGLQGLQGLQGNSGNRSEAASFSRVEVGADEDGGALVLGGGRVSVGDGAGGAETAACVVLSREGLSEQCGAGLRLEAQPGAGVSLGGDEVSVETRDGLAVSAGAGPGATVRFSRLSRGGFSLATDARRPAEEAGGGSAGEVEGGGLPAPTLTTGGRECQFPMLIAGEEHYACVPFEGLYWCIDSQGLWDQCAGQSDPGFEQSQVRRKSLAPPPGSREGDLEVRAAGDLTLTTGASGGGVRVSGLGGGVRLEGGVTVEAAPGQSSLGVRGVAAADEVRVGAGGLAVAGPAAVDGGVRVEGLGQLAGGLQVEGPAEMRGGLAVVGPAAFRGPESTVFAGGARVGASLEVAAEAQIQGPLFVAGESSLQSLRLSGGADVAGKGSFGRLETRRGLTVRGPLHVPGAGRVGNLTVGALTVHNLTVTGRVTGLDLGGAEGGGAAREAWASAQTAATRGRQDAQDLRVRESLRVGGDAVLDRGLEVAGGLRAAGGLEAEGLCELERARVQDLMVSSSLDVRAAARFRNRPVFEKGLAVRGPQQTSTFAGRAEFAGDVAVAGALALTGEAPLRVRQAEADTVRARAVLLDGGGEVRGARQVASERLRVGRAGAFPPDFDKVSLLVGGSGVLSGTFTLGESLAVGGDVDVPDGRLKAGHLASGGSLEVGGDGVVEGTLSVVGEVLAMGAARLGADLSVAGEAKVGHDLVVRGGAQVGGDLVVENLIVRGRIVEEGAGRGGGGGLRAGRGGGRGLLQEEGAPRGGEPSYVEAEASRDLPDAVSLAAAGRCGIELRLPACRSPGRVVSVRDISGAASPRCPVAVAGAWGGAQGGLPGPAAGGAVLLEEPFGALDAFCTRSGRWFRLGQSASPLGARVVNPQ